MKQVRDQQEVWAVLVRYPLPFSGEYILAICASEEIAGKVAEERKEKVPFEAIDIVPFPVMHKYGYPALED